MSARTGWVTLVRGNLWKIKCGGAECSANYPLSLFRIPPPKNSAFPWIAKLLFAHIVQQMCNRCITASGILGSFPSILFVVHLPKNRVVTVAEYGKLSRGNLRKIKCGTFRKLPIIAFPHSAAEKFRISTDHKTAVCSHCTTDVQPMHSSIRHPGVLSFHTLCGPFAKEQGSYYFD